MANSRSRSGWRSRPSSGFREGHGGDLACPHRDVSCCDACALAHPEIVEVYGQHFWSASKADHDALVAELAKSKLRRG